MLKSDVPICSISCWSIVSLCCWLQRLWAATLSPYPAGVSWRALGLKNYFNEASRGIFHPLPPNTFTISTQLVTLCTMSREEASSEPGCYPFSMCQAFMIIPIQLNNARLAQKKRKMRGRGKKSRTWKRSTCFSVVRSLLSIAPLPASARIPLPCKVHIF